MKRSVLTAAAATLLCGGLLANSGCFLTNISADDCTSNVECEDVFGLGSACTDGFCSDPPTCETAHGCRSAFGGGACVEGICRDKAPPDPTGACTMFEPEDLLDRSLTRNDPFTVVGAMFRLEDSSDFRVALGAQLGIREIQGISGLNEGRSVGMVFCDNGAELDDDARAERIRSNIDYLSGTLGTPFIVGPGLSSDALGAINHVVSQAYPTVLISPSATSPALTSEPDRLNPGDPHGLFWRTAPSDQLQGVLLATSVIGVYPEPPPAVVKVAVVHIDDAYGAGLASVFQNEWISPPQEARSFPFAASGDNDWAAIAGQVVGYAPEAIMLVAIDARDAVSFIQEMAGLAPIASLPVYLTDGSKDANALLDDSLDDAVKTIIFNQLVGTAPAGPDPAGVAFSVFQGNYQAAFSEDPAGFSFVANAYDAAYVGAAGVVWAAQEGSAYNGLDVAAGMARLVGGSPRIDIAKSQWSAIKSGLTTGGKQVDIVGISGELDFDPALGEATAPIEIWQPSRTAGDCGTATTCFKEIARIAPSDM